MIFASESGVDVYCLMFFQCGMVVEACVWRLAEDAEFGCKSMIQFENDALNAIIAQ